MSQVDNIFNGNSCIFKRQNQIIMHIKENSKFVKKIFPIAGVYSSETNQITEVSVGKGWDTLKEAIDFVKEQQEAVQTFQEKTGIMWFNTEEKVGKVFDPKGQTITHVFYFSGKFVEQFAKK
jgi:hypothetical protein